MRSLKAVIVGILFVLIAVVLVQLAYIFLAVGYTHLARDYPVMNEISPFLRYLIAMPVILFIMFMGGLFTASLARQRIMLHCLFVALMTNAVITGAAIEYADLTLTGMVMVVLGIIATLAGGGYWQRQHHSQKHAAHS